MVAKQSPVPVSHVVVVDVAVVHKLLQLSQKSQRLPVDVLQLSKKGVDVLQLSKKSRPVAIVLQLSKQSQPKV